MLPLATQNSLLVEWLVPFQVGFSPTLFQALAGRTACQQCAANFAARFLYNFNSACQEHPGKSALLISQLALYIILIVPVKNILD